MTAIVSSRTNLEREADEVTRPDAPKAIPFYDRLRYRGDGTARDLRIDFLRGVAIVVMVSNHLTARSWINTVTQGRIYASAAEGFIVLSGLVLGMVSLGRVKKLGLKEATKKLVERAWTLYKATMVLSVVALAATFIHPGAARPLFDEMPATGFRLAWALPTMHLEPRILDILQLYVYCLAGAPILLWALERGYGLAVTAGSIAIWYVHQRHPYAMSLESFGRDHSYFSLASWQLLFVVSFVAGYHRAPIAKVWSKIPRPVLFLVTIPAVVYLAKLNQKDVVLGVWPVGASARIDWLALTDRSLLGGIRIVTLSALFPLMFLVVDAFWRPLERTLGRFLIPLGQNSLYVFLVHVPFVVLWFALPKMAGSTGLLATAGQLAVLSTVYVMVSRKVLFNVVPR
ncbi:OpgC domain-containing protein [soil metagenome]